MSRHDDRVSMRQMRAHAQEAIAMGGGKTRDEIVADRKLQSTITVDFPARHAAGRDSRPLIGLQLLPCSQ
jgi:hypothetical protein